MSIVEVRGLTKAYGGRPPALTDVTLEIGPGVTGLLGPNGAGKSTLLQCVLGLLPDYTGDVTVLGLDARRERRALRRKVGFMPETDAYLHGMTGLHAVRYLGQLTGMPRREALRRAHEVLWHVGLGEAIYRGVQDYSTGMRQRFRLAQALVHDPELVFLDEPLAGMDPKGRGQLRALITKLARESGKHIVWSSHLLPDVQRVADAVLVLHQGRSRGSFRLEDLSAQAGRFTLEVEGDGEALAARLDALHVARTPADAIHATADRRTWTLVCPPELDAAALLAAAHESGTRVRRLVPLAERLEDVFLRILHDGEAA